MLTITRKDMLLTINDNVIPAMGSSDVPVSFVNDIETYVGFLIEPRVGYYVNGCPKSTVCEYDTSSNIIKIPAEAFKQRGVLVIAIALIDNDDSNHIEVTKELALEVTPAPNGAVIFPATDTWQTAVNNLVEQIYNQDYKPQFDQIEEDLSGLVEEAENQQSKAKEQQTQIDNAIDIMGDYEIVQDNPTQIRFKKGDGTYGDTVNLGDNLASKSMVNVGYDTYSGNSYSGPSSDYGIEIGKASGNCEQVTTTGKNLFDINKINTVGSSLINNGNGSLTVKTNSSSSGVSSNMLLSEACPTLEVGKTYTLQANSTGSNKFIYLSGINVSLHFGSSFTVTQAHLDSMILFYASGTDTSTTISDIQIELGSVSTDYEPFTGGEPSPNPNYPQEPKFFEPKEIVSVGKNLYNKNNVIDGKYVNTTNGLIVDLSYASVSDYIPVIPNTNYVTTRKDGSGHGLAFFDKNKTYIKGLNISKMDSFVTPENAYYVRINAWENQSWSDGLDKETLMLCQGDSLPNYYVPFEGQDTTPLNIELRSLPNGVRDTYENGVVTRRVGIYIVDTIGSLQTLTSSGRKFFALNTGNKKHQDGMISFLCNKIQKTEAGTQDDCIYQNPLNFVIVGTADDTLETFKERFLNTIVYYELAEPYTEQVDLPVIPSYSPYTNAWHDSEVEANDLTWHVLTAVNGKSSIRDGLGSLLKDAPMTPNDNLLINSDYRSGIINQKSITSLDKSDGSTELGIDGWILYGINIAVGTNYVTFANRTSAIHTVQQPLDIKGLKAGDKITVYVSAFNITGSIYVYLTGLDAQRKKLVNGDNKFTFTLTSEIERFYILLAPNAVISFNCMKLEIGEYFTGMPAWNEASELLKCMYLFEKKVINVMCSQFGATTCYANIPYSIPKIKTPSITGKCTWIGSNTGEGIGETKITKLEATAIQKEYVDIKVTHESAKFGQYSRNVFVELYIDAYNY